MMWANVLVKWRWEVLPTPPDQFLWWMENYRLKIAGIMEPKYKGNLDKSVIEMNNYTDVVLKLNDILNSTKRNKYYWNLLLALYNFQTTTPRLLLALKQSDSTDKTQHEKGIEQIQQAMTEFHQAWQALQTVYCETRFFADPSNYIADRYFHLASQREDLSWMIQAQELYENIINKWLQNQ